MFMMAYVLRFSQVFFFVILFSKNFIFLTLELSSLILSIGSCFCEKNCLWSIEITKCYLWSLDHQDYNLFFTLALCLSLLCRVIVFERGVVCFKCSVVIPQWRSLCGRSCVDIVEILLCEGGDVEQWLEPQNLCLIHYLLLCLSYILHYLYCSYLIHARYCLCTHTCVEPRELHIAPQLLFRGIKWR